MIEDLRQFYKDFLTLTDSVLPALTSSEIPIYVQLFARSVAVGQTACRISHGRLSELSGQGIRTVRTALRGLIGKGLIVQATEAAPRQAPAYEVVWPPVSTEPRGYRPRNAADFLPEDSTRDLWERLGEQDRRMVSLLRRRMRPEELADFYREAGESLRPGQDIEQKVLDLIAQRRLGPAVLAKYGY